MLRLHRSSKGGELCISRQEQLLQTVSFGVCMQLHECTCISGCTAAVSASALDARYVIHDTYGGRSINSGFLGSV